MKEAKNGVIIPYDKSVEELEAMSEIDDMSQFAVVCEALSYKTDKKAFDILKKYSTSKDKYKRLCVLKTIFRHPESEIAKDFLEESILSSDILFAENGLQIVWEHGILPSENVIISAVEKHFLKLSDTSLYALETIGVNEINFKKLVKWFGMSVNCGQKEVLGGILVKKYLPEKASELFSLFSADEFAKIRMIALKIGKEYKFDISKFLNDTDGHIRNAATKQ